ncbi:MAG: CsbD family protein [bacterium]
MKGLTKVLKGRIEEAAGALTGNDKLRAKGQTDQSVGHIKQAAEKVIGQFEKSVGKILDKAVK